MKSQFENTQEYMVDSKNSVYMNLEYHNKM
jgi:hypothetical protein